MGNKLTANIWQPKKKKYQVAHYENGHFVFYTGPFYKVRLNDAKFHNDTEKKSFYSQIKLN